MTGSLGATHTRQRATSETGNVRGCRFFHFHAMPRKTASPPQGGCYEQAAYTHSRCGNFARVGAPRCCRGAMGIAGSAGAHRPGPQPRNPVPVDGQSGRTGAPSCAHLEWIDVCAPCYDASSKRWPLRARTGRNFHCVPTTNGTEFSREMGFKGSRVLIPPSQPLTPSSSALAKMSGRGVAQLKCRRCGRASGMRRHRP